MPVSRANLAVYQGDDYAAAVTVYDSTGANANLAGYTVAAQIRRGVANRFPGTSDIVLPIATSLTLPNVINLGMAAVDTATLIGPYAWDLQLTAASGVVSTILNGSVVVTAQVTV
jgi:hypothetical protein